MILLTLLLTTFAHANFWGFEDYTAQDWAALESTYIQQRVDDATKLREKVRAFARKNGGLKESQEWAEDGMENAPTNIDFSTHGGLDCLAATYWPDIRCVKVQ